MCGICGFTGRQNEVVLKAMAGSMIHRGPDEDGFYSDGKINLGMRRLSIIDLATGSQPIHNEDKSVWTVFNGEIYNSPALRAQLEGRGHKFYTDHSDTEVIVHSYEEYAEEFLEDFNGMFALAVWDKARETLLVARDRMGVKPLFYCVLNGTFIFASEIKAILKNPLYSRSLNYEAVYHYFTFKNVPAPLTAFEGIYSLLPGEMLTFHAGDVKKIKWWKVSFNEDKSLDPGAAREKIAGLLENATRIRMVSDVPIGAYLSGGVDSSAVVAMMAKFSGRPIKTFSLGYEGELKNKEADLYYARKVAKAFGTEHREYIMSHKEAARGIPEVIRSFDQPFSGTISTFFLTKLISKHVKVALSGDGADELFGSYLSHRVAASMSRLVASRKGLGQEDERAFLPPGREFLEDLLAKSGPGEADWRYHLYLFTDKEKAGLLSEDLLNRVNRISTQELVRRNFTGLTSSDPLNRILEMEWNTQFPDQVLAFVDFLSMAHSVEIRSPFVDHRLVEFCATIPGDMKIRENEVKYILKQTAEGLIPEGITARQKEGFVMPVFDWLGKELKDFARDTLSDERLKRHGFFNLARVRSIIEEFDSGNKAVAGRIWNLMMFQVWWEEYFG